MKSPVGYKVDPKILKKFKENADKNSLNMSNWVEKKMIEYNDKCAQFEALEKNKGL